ncbi:MAG: DUF4179 domain-containing protein, partial [Eubacterium sp.]|nr:DUF4179 domain-containing protein [Eubacterium sp.]
MKYNLSDILNDMDVRETEAIIDNIKINYNETIAQKIKERVITEEEHTKEKHNKAKRLSFKTILAFAAVFLILLTSVTVGATAYFVPDSSIAHFFNFSDTTDLSTIGQDVNCVSESNGYELKLTQVISDNSTMYLGFEGPVVDGYTLLPDFDKATLSINGFDIRYFSQGESHDNGLFYVAYNGVQHLFNNSKIKVDFNSLYYYDDDKGKETYFDGHWSFEFNYKRVDVQKKVDTNGFYSYMGNTYEITDCVLSPLGIYIKGKETDSFSLEKIKETAKEQIQNDTSDFRIELKDGTVYTGKDTEQMDGSFGRSLGEKRGHSTLN